jgi:hypothetical protein
VRSRGRRAGREEWEVGGKQDADGGGSTGQLGGPEMVARG